jgi:PiT family inorganic phosphate transporter
MEIKTVKKLDSKAIKQSKGDFFKLGGAIAFMLVVMLYTFVQHGGIPQSTFLAVAALIGGYMAMNIGANDVANNVGPAVGSKALTLTGAIIIAMIFEAGGALIAGGEVVSTIKKGIIDPSMFTDVNVFMWAMMAALLGGAIWLNFATVIGAPVSTTHSIVGGVMGGGIAAAGFEIVKWSKMGKIIASWVISPVLGGIIAAIFLFIIKKNIIYKDDMVASAKKFVPILIAAMSMAFVTYLAIKGIKKIIKIDLITALGIGGIVSIFIFIIVKPLVTKASQKLLNHRDDINKLFTIPLIFAAALLSFAHGANDVANAIGPLAAINDAVVNAAIAKKASIPLWVMMVGAFGIAVGLALYGPKLIRTVGSEITELDQMRAWSVAMASSIVVILASWLGLPVSSTHIAIGGIFGVGFSRTYIDGHYQNKIEGIKLAHTENLHKEITELKKKILTTNIEKDKNSFEKEINIKREELEDIRLGKIDFTKKEKKALKKLKKEKYVKKEMLVKIAAAWLITVPASAILAGVLFFTIKGIMIN